MRRLIGLVGVVALALVILLVDHVAGGGSGTGAPASPSAAAESGGTGHGGVGPGGDAPVAITLPPAGLDSNAPPQDLVLVPGGPEVVNTTGVIPNATVVTWAQAYLATHRAQGAAIQSMDPSRLTPLVDAGMRDRLFGRVVPTMTLAAQDGYHVTVTGDVQYWQLALIQLTASQQQAIRLLGETPHDYAFYVVESGPVTLSVLRTNPTGPDDVISETDVVPTNPVALMVVGHFVHDPARGDLWVVGASVECPVQSAARPAACPPVGG